ncbi:MAG: sugar nucleotide-binding protein [Clostridia bacterium]|nr:sugar nucleotide-binding protein [Clostridia bacterium]
MRFLVLGCNGMAGHTIALYLQEQGYDVIGFAKNKSKYVESIAGDALDTEKLKKIIIDGKFDTVINCIGILNNFAEQNKAMAVSLNSYLPHALVEITKDTDTQIIHMSTDCVFSGKSGNYTETSLRDGETFYDRSKALGEIEDDKNLTLRNSIVGPDINQNGIGLLNWFMQQNGPIQGYTKAIWTGQTTLQLAKTMEAAALNKAHGLYNAVPKESISKYELLQLFNKYLRNDKLVINPVEGVNLNKTLIRTRYNFDFEIPNYEIMVREMAEWMFNHKSMYPHYSLETINE